jgi:hypothetical protein
MAAGGGSGREAGSSLNATGVMTAEMLAGGASETMPATSTPPSAPVRPFRSAATVATLGAFAAGSARAGKFATFGGLVNVRERAGTASRRGISDTVTIDTRRSEAVTLRSGVCVVDVSLQPSRPLTSPPASRIISAAELETLAVDPAATARDTGTTLAFSTTSGSSSCSLSLTKSSSKSGNAWLSPFWLSDRSVGNAVRASCPPSR